MTLEKNTLSGVRSNSSVQLQSPSKLRLFKHIWPSKEENENSIVDNINNHSFEDTINNVENDDNIEVTSKSKKRGFFTIRSRKNIGKDATSVSDGEDLNEFKEYQLGEYKLPTNECKFKEAHRINMSPLSKSAGFGDTDSMFGNSDSEMSSEIITNIAPDREITSNNDSIQISNNLNIKNDEDNATPCSKASNSVYTLVTEISKPSVVSLYVGDLDKSVTELDLHSFFATSPGLVSVKIPRNSLTGESLGYGYVNIENKKFANDAIEKLNYTKLGPSEIRIMPSIRDKEEREKTGTNIFISHLPPSLTTRFLYDKFKEFGKILSCKYSNERNTCFINYEDRLNAFKVCKLFNKTEMDGHTILASIHILKKDRLTFQSAKNTFKTSECLSSITDDNETAPKEENELSSNAINVTGEPISVNFKITKMGSESATLFESLKNSEPKANTQFSIFMRNLPMFIKDDVIKRLVEQYGTVTSVLSRKVPTKQGAWALVTMTNKDSVDKAVSNLNFVELEGKQLFVTRAIPREQKAYARRNETFPKKKRKILVSGLNMSLHRTQLENWCSQYPSIKSVEMYGTSQGGNDNNGYGYIEIDSEDDASDLMIRLKSLGISCYKVMIELPNTDANFETPRYPYMIQSPTALPGYFETSKNIPPVSFSYVDPTKMYQIAELNNKVTFDKYSELNRRESYVKRRIVKDENDEEEIINKISEIVWELAVRMFTPVRGNHGFKSVNPIEVINKTRVSSLTDHMIKFFWAKNIEEFYHFLKINQCDNGGNIILPPHPLIERQIVQSAMYLGIIPKQ